jgi:hypothetical protein
MEGAARIILPNVDHLYFPTEFRQLKYFVVIVENGSISNATQRPFNAMLYEQRSSAANQNASRWDPSLHQQRPRIRACRHKTLSRGPDRTRVIRPTEQRW